MERYICIHGHFYQPPRENPWLESIELQDSAYPYHDWNERITAECYAPNATARILGEEGRIVEIVNNYSRISFNFGPTLLNWMEEKAPDTYQAILEADRESQSHFSGHGSAIAQAYNHLIMPLATARDKLTQVKWGIRDFESRFNRKPEGMWLPETAVDLETLEILAEHGLKFTILAGRQARRVRARNAADWVDTPNGAIDPTRPYTCRLPSGKQMAVFFYDGPISQAIAFERLLNKGELLAERLSGGFSPAGSRDQLVHVATDGETYGHHHRYGDMALAYALRTIETQRLARLTNYGEYLDMHPPEFEVEIHENSSWSCVHGVERWRSNCGCNSGGHTGWNQEWRGPLRESLDWLRDEINPRFEALAGELLRDPWATRNDYIEVLLNRSPEVVAEFLTAHGKRELSESERITALKLLEIQRQLLLMYTSCGWFFDDLSGIETVQVIQYAGRAIQLAHEVFGIDFEEPFVGRLAKAKSNVPNLKDGQFIYRRFVKASSMDLPKAAAHYAISSLFDTGTDAMKAYCYDVAYDDYNSFTAGKARLTVGEIRIFSEITMESGKFMFAILYFGDHNLMGGVCRFESDDIYKKWLDEIDPIFSKADFTETIRSMDRTFGGSTYSLKTLFRDEQRKILNSILETTLLDAESMLRQVYENNAPLMRFLADLWVPLPKALQASAEFVLNMNLKHSFEKGELDLHRISSIFNESREARVVLDKAGLAYTFEKRLERMMEDLWSDPEDRAILAELDAAAGLIPKLPFDVNVWSIQNNFYEMMKRVYPDIRKKSDAGDSDAKAWVASFQSLGEKLRVQVA